MMNKPKLIHSDVKPAIRKGETELPESRVSGKFEGGGCPPKSWPAYCVKLVFWPVSGVWPLYDVYVTFIGLCRPDID